MRHAQVTQTHDEVYSLRNGTATEPSPGLICVNLLLYRTAAIDRSSLRLSNLIACEGRVSRNTGGW